jgi:hypothetical protein
MVVTSRSTSVSVGDGRGWNCSPASPTVVNTPSRTVESGRGVPSKAVKSLRVSAKSNASLRLIRTRRRTKLRHPGGRFLR